MKLGLSTWSLLGLDVYSAVRAIGDSGIEYVELWGELPHAYPGVVDAKELREVLSSYSMTVSAHAPFTDLNPASPEPLVRGTVEKVLERFVEFAAGLGAVMVTVHPGTVHNAQLVEGAGPSSVATLRKMIAAAAGRLSVNVENLSKGTSPYHYPLASDVASLEAILADLDGAECTLDTGHAHVSGFAPLGLAERLGPRLVEVHLSDNSGRSDEHLLPGRGTTPLEKFMGRVSESDALVCLELNPHIYGRDEVLRGFEEVRRLFG